MIDEISNVSPQRVITPPNNVFDKPDENAKSGKPDQRVEEKTTKNVIENGTLILEYTLANSVTPIFAKTYPRVIQQIERQTD